MRTSTPHRITLQPFLYGNTKLLVFSEVPKDLKSNLLTIPGIEWSDRRKRLYMPHSQVQIRSLLMWIKGKGYWVDQRALKETKTARLQTTSAGRKTDQPIDADTLAQLKSYTAYLETQRYAVPTIKSYTSLMTHFFAKSGISFREITKEKIMEYNHLHFINGKKSYSSQNTWISALKLFIQARDLTHVEVSDLERPRKPTTLPDVLSAKEVERIFQQITNQKHRCLLMLIYSCGLRIGEALALQLSDIRSDENLIYIRHGKGAKDRRVPLSQVILKALRSYYYYDKPKHFLFEGKPGIPYSQSSARQILKKACHRAGIKRKITLHTLRHSYATHLTNRGVNIQYLQEILGHANPKTTMLYTHLSAKDIRNVRSPLDDLDIR